MVVGEGAAGMDAFQRHCTDRNRQSVLRLRAVTTFVSRRNSARIPGKKFLSCNFRNFYMPLVHQDKSRDGGGSRENRRSLTNFIGFDALQFPEPAASSNSEHDSIDGVSGGSADKSRQQWEQWQPASPEAAQTPRSLVPATCFPPGHPSGFASYSESARPGSWADDSHANWTDDGSLDWPDVPGRVTDLVTSMKTLTMSPADFSRGSGNLQMTQEHFLHEGNGINMQPPWPPEQASTSMINSAPVKPYIPEPRRGCKSEPLRWSGRLPPRGTDASSGYSSKVFVGGLPWDITEDDLLYSLRNFQPIRVEWPGREVREGREGPCGGERGGGGEQVSPRGYAYITFENDRRVRSLLSAARSDGGNWYYRVSSRNMRNKEVQVIPWAVSDSNYVCGGSVRLEPARTVFVGALHGMLGAYGLALIMNDLFGGVVYAGIDTDKNKYPIGSGRVTFNNAHSYLRAIAAAYVEINTDKFTKIVQVDPYLEDSMCSLCNLQQGPYFCRDPVCFRYFCRACWAWQHRSLNHKQLMRWSKNSQNGGSGPRHALPASAPHAARTPMSPSGPSPPPALAAPAAPYEPPQCVEQPAYNGYAGSCDGTPSPDPSEYDISSALPAHTQYEASKLNEDNSWK